MTKTVIFDVDGTLVDIQPLFFRLFNTLAGEFGYSPIRPEEIPELKRFHLKELLFKRLGWRIVFLPWILKRGRAEYRKFVPHVELFPGIAQLISSLQGTGCRIGIVSSSEAGTVLALLNTFGIHADFVYHSSLFGKARALKRALQEQSLSATDVLYVGDEVRDVEACREAGIPIIAVTWGLNSQAALHAAGAETVDTREALLERLLT